MDSTKAITLSELRQEKSELEEDILKRIRAFEKRTGVHVEDITLITYLDGLGAPMADLVNAKLYLGL